MLCQGLYILAGQDVTLPYKDIWTSSNMPSYDHYFLRSVSEVQKYKRHILLLRDPYSHQQTTRTIDHTGPFHGGHEGFTLPNNDPASGSARYVHQIKKFDLLELPKRVVYYEELIKDKKELLEVADFVGINYNLEKIDFDLISQKSKNLYLSSGHRSALRKQPPFPRLERTKTMENIRSKIQNDEIYNRYLKRYERG